MQLFLYCIIEQLGKKRNDIFIIEKPNIKPKVFEIVLRYICSGTIDWNMLEGEDFLDCHNFKTLDESIFQSLLSEEENFVHDGVIWNLLILWACSSKIQF
ncbi:unnamed protein product [Rhizophagus irregularis]|nr:unnamed protein product [Rhizophagus irregularis]